MWAGGWSSPFGGLSPPWELTQLCRPILENETEGLISLQNFLIHSFFKVLLGADYMPGPAGTVMSKVGLVLVPTSCHNETPYFSLLGTVPDSVLRAFHLLTHSCQPGGLSTFIIPPLQMGKLRLRMVKYFSRDHSTSQLWSRDLIPGSLVPSILAITAIPHHPRGVYELERRDGQEQVNTTIPESGRQKPKK